MAKIKTVGTISEFMGGRVAEKAKTEARKRRYEVGVLPATIGGGALVLAPMTALAAEPETVTVFGGSIADSVKDKAMQAFDPIIDLVQLCAYPLGLITLMSGALFIMIGNRDRGVTVMQGASIGYLLIQGAPLFMRILSEIGGAVF